MIDETEIQSEQNAKLKRLRAIRAGKERDFVLLEGARVVADAIQAGIKLSWVLYDAEMEAEEQSCVSREALKLAQEKEIQCLPCTPKLLALGGDLKTASRILGCAERPQMAAADLLQQAKASNGLVVVSAGIQDPGNAGALIRCAAGLGAFGVRFLKGGVSPWHPRALRGASGTTFRLPVAEGVLAADLKALCQEAGLALWATSTEGEALHKVRRDQAVALVLGEEGGGLPAELDGCFDKMVGIPLQRDVESLNVATAAALLIHALS
ncbi:MAG: RNA methyltransferase [Planctomycetes bacterium]|nr:RNA methyltransferase [Planctomycetota bacterium]